MQLSTGEALAQKAQITLSGVLLLMYDPLLSLLYLASKSGPQERSDIYESACGVLLGRVEGEHHAGRLYVSSASSYEGLHIRLRYPAPDHLACIEVSTFSHLPAGRILVQEFNRRISFKPHFDIRPAN